MTKKQEPVLSAPFALQVVRSLYQEASKRASRMSCPQKYGDPKEHLQLSHLWSAKWEVVQVHIWCALLLAQLFHGLQVQLAAQEGVDPFDVSIELLVEIVPPLLQRGIAPLSALGRRGRELGLIRPSTRLQVQVPFVDATWMSPAPPEALQPRETARYAQRKCEPGKRPKTKKAG